MAFDVYNELGFVFREPTCLAAMTVAFQDCRLEVARQVSIPMWFRGKKMGRYFADIVEERKVLLELKAGGWLEPAHAAQLLHYLQGTEVEIGLLLNFAFRPQFRRLILDNERKKIRGNPSESVAEVSA